MNAEVTPSQWEFQVCDFGINAADDLIILKDTFVIEPSKRKD